MWRVSDDLFVQPQLHQLWLLALVCLLLCGQAFTTVFVPCPDWWEIRWRDTTWIHYLVGVVLPCPDWWEILWRDTTWIHYLVAVVLLRIIGSNDLAVNYHVVLSPYIPSCNSINQRLMYHAVLSPYIPSCNSISTRLRYHVVLPPTSHQAIPAANSWCISLHPTYNSIS